MTYDAPAQPPGMTDLEFQVFRDLVHRETGIALGPHKRTLLEARLTRRLRALRLPSFSAYHELLRKRDPTGEERTRFVNAITTNETSFFREQAHFAYLASEWLPARRASATATGDRRIRVWSAACSTGEEPYSVAMTLLAGLDTAAWDVKILASDIDTDVLGRAVAGVYALEATASMSLPQLRRFFLRGVGPQNGRVRVRPEVRALVSFRRINLLEPAWPIRTRFDLIFCRNVLMYFDRPTQMQLVARLGDLLAPGGFLALGHAENLLGLTTNMQRVTSTIYRRADAVPA